MIVRPADGVLHLISQPDHAALARRVMERWQPLEGEARREVILLAIEQHDNGWRELDEAPLVDPATGGLADFVHVHADLRQGVWLRGSTRAAGMHPWAGALVAHHAISVYQRFRQDPDWTGFFADMETRRARLVEAAALTMQELAADYVFLRLGDLVSLAFCTRSAADTRHAGSRLRLVGNRVVVEPDPFGDAEVPFSVPARVIADRRYASDADLRNACRAAETVVLHGIAAGA